MAGVLAQLAKHIADCRVERLQLEGLDQHRRVYPLEEKLDSRIVPVAGKKNEPLTSSRPHPRDRPVKHLAADLRHHHVANDEIEGALHDLAQALDAVWDRGDLKAAGGQVIVENLPEIVAIFQEQNSLGRPGRVVRRNLDRGRPLLIWVNVESDNLLHGIASLRGRRHSPKLMSKTGALGPRPSVRSTTLC